MNIKEYGIIQANGEIMKYKITIFSFLILLIFLIGISISIGSVRIDIIDVYKIIIVKLFPFLNINNNEVLEYIVWNLRMPRVLGAIIIGAILASSGVVCQSILRNPLASPFTIGLSSAAAFGASIAIILGAGIAYGSYTFIITNEFFIITNAFILCLICSIVISIIARIKGTNPTVIVLTGIAIGYFFSAFTSILQYTSQAEALKAVIVWLLGDLGLLNWKKLIWISSGLIGIIIFIHMGWRLNAFNMGEEIASSLGINIKKIRAICIIVMGFMIAVTISFVGVIGFICLVSPHIARIIIGNDNRKLIITSSLIGSNLLLLSDTIARTVFSPLILPVGAITSLIGGPFFVYLLIKSRRMYWS